LGHVLIWYSNAGFVNCYPNSVHNPEEGFLALCYILCSIIALPTYLCSCICGRMVRRAPGVFMTLAIKRECVELIWISTNQCRKDFWHCVQYNSISHRSSIVHLRQNTWRSSRSVHEMLNQGVTCRTHVDMRKSMQDGFWAFCCILYNITALPADPRSCICGSTL
jgi:hypothetical protein